MAGSRVGPVPFAFLLALASEANASQVPLPTDGRDQLKPGMLSDLLKQNANPEFSIKSVEQQRDGATTTVVQYFPNFPNFRNCFSGQWRNC
ncbi:hypothetical protein [Bradyrhizobium sp. McL0615]|uniref:hypothetical protein n=1 Tax=Bradyrhizobium sp. McL0615 TaxID=3415673 RepID=UPI003CEB8025